MPSGISSSGLFCFIDSSRWPRFLLASGLMMFWKKNELMEMIMTIVTRERHACMSDMPAALIAVSSQLSPKFPNVINDERSIAKGNACGMSMRAMYQKNCAITSSDSPLPISSSTYRQRNCIISTNWQMKNVATNRSPNCFAINMSNFLKRNISCLIYTKAFRTAKLA